MSEEMGLIWVSKELEKEYNSFEDVSKQEAVIKKIIERKKIDIEQENEQLSDSLLQFKHTCLVHKRELEKVYHEESEKLYKLWEEMGDISSEVIRHARKVATEISPIKTAVSQLQSDISHLKKELSGLNFYIPDRLVEIASIVGKMDESTKTLLRDLLQKKEEK